MDVLQRLQNNFIQVGEDIRDIAVRSAKIGNLDNLQTIDKSTLVMAINELLHSHLILAGGGRPDEISSLSPGTAAKVSAAADGDVFKSTDGAQVKAYQWMKVEGKWKAVVADTGWIDLSDTDTPLMKIRRIGDVVHIQLDKWRGHRISLPEGFTFGDKFLQFLAGSPGKTPELAVISSTGDLFKQNTNQSRPYGSTTAGTFWGGTVQNTDLWKRHEKGAKCYFSFATPDPWPSSLSLSKLPQETLPTIVHPNELYCDATGYSAWGAPGNFAAHSATAPITGVSGIEIQINQDTATTGVVLELRAGADASKLNGATISYKLRGGFFIAPSGVTLSGHTDNEKEGRRYVIPVADIEILQIEKPALELKGFLVGLILP